MKDKQSLTPCNSETSFNEREVLEKNAKYIFSTINLSHHEIIGKEDEIE